MSTLLVLTTAVVLAAGDVPRAGAEPVDGAPLVLAQSLTDATVQARAETGAPQTSRAVRVVTEVLVAGAAGTLAGGLGGWLGCTASTSQGSCSQGTTAAGLVSGFALGVAVMVPLTGSYFDAQGSPWVAWFGQALGAGAGLAIARTNSSLLMWVAPPLMLAGAVLGYELSAHGPTPAAPAAGRVVVVPSFGPDGRAGLAVAGRF
jgi:hypothetical protein